MMQQDTPEDYVLSTGKKISVRDFCTMAFKHLDIDIEWIGTGKDERGIDKKTGKVIVEIDPEYFRPTEVDQLLGDSTKARTKLGWEPKYTVEDLCKEMVYSDFEKISRKFVENEKRF